MGYFWDGDKPLQDALKRQVKEDVKSETGYSAEALAAAAQDALKIKDGIEKGDAQKTAAGLTGSGHSVMHDMLEKACDKRVAENIVRAGLGSEHLSTGVGGLEESAQKAKKVIETTEKSPSSKAEDALGFDFDLLFAQSGKGPGGR